LQKTWGGEEAFYCFCGAAEVGLAWVSRGGGFADTVTAKGAAGFDKHLAQAEKHLNTAWQMNSSNAHTAYLMMQVELGQGQGRSRMQQWFDRAMRLDPSSFDAVKLMSFYLEPRWYGSDEAALEFARACVASTNYTGNVAMILPEVHHSLAKYYKRAESPDYWHRPEVWADIKSTYETFFQRNPQAVGHRHNYARDAYLCGHYAEFLAQAKLFATGTNYSYFGGEARFNQMLGQAARN
ncbi:MAG TPA: hypothetical protein VNZ22_05235, partial [Bacillota bacterium]|nr:hypothetical protein [Bacillota bacterium]